MSKMSVLIAPNAVLLRRIMFSCIFCIVFCFFLCLGDPRDLHSFPTRRSSDLARRQPRRPGGRVLRHGRRRRGGGRGEEHDRLRSEEHTSELQSRENLVCRLLLEKKK